MKAIQILIVLTLCSIMLVHGQNYPVSKNSGILSGSMSFSSTQTTLTGRYFIAQTNFSTSYDHFIFNHFMMGFETGFQGLHYKANNESYIYLGPQLGVAFGNATSTIFPYIKAYHRYSVQFIDNSTGMDNYSGNTLAIAAGIIVPIKSHLGLGIELAYCRSYYYWGKQFDLLMSFTINGLLYKDN
ncbi:MAG TPA: hypothetical protein PLZ52_07620 [Bacteroidales bacterium]|nr:hypothetical protein [Bacteroidales bacterium]HOE05070.1 hypothetical protein [Bacteroidales bacterium]HQL71040.1 hypothetical protein [Bacteroidales bacterium]